MQRRKSIALIGGGLGGALTACGSELHMPGETINMPSSISVGQQPGQQPGQSGSSSDTDDMVEIPNTFPVFAHYMDWATVPGSWPVASILPIRRDNPAGGYDSRNPEIILQHNAEMQANGILPMVSWWERNSHAGDHFLDLYLSIPGPQIGILYEAVGPGRMQFAGSGTTARLLSKFGPPATPYELPQMGRRTLQALAAKSGIDMGNPVHANMFVDDMRHLQEKYFSRYPDRFYRIDGKPVVFIWISHAFTGPFEQVAERARQHASFFLVGGEFGTPWGSMPPEHITVLRAMDAITSYGFYDPRHYGLDMDTRFVDDYRKSIGDCTDWLSRNSPKTKLIPPMNFAYDETLLPDRNGIVFRSSYEIAREYAQTVRSVLADRCRRGLVRVGYLTSYTEHYEGTAVEPSDKYQDNYLRIIRETFSVPAAPGSGTSGHRCRDKSQDGPSR